MNTNAKVAIGFVGFVILIVLVFVAIAVAVPAAANDPGGALSEGRLDCEVRIDGVATDSVPFIADRGTTIG